MLFVIWSFTEVVTCFLLKSSTLIVLNPKFQTSKVPIDWEDPSSDSDYSDPDVNFISNEDHIVKCNFFGKISNRKRKPYIIVVLPRIMFTLVFFVTTLSTEHVFTYLVSSRSPVTRTVSLTPPQLYLS